MATVKKRTNFFESEEGVQIKAMLEFMATDTQFNTESSYNANATLYPTNVMSFVEKHMNYLITHPAMDPHHYVANLRLKTRKR